MRRYEHFSHCSTCPPRAAVRQVAMARSTWCCSALVGCVRRYSSPCARTTSATSYRAQACSPGAPAVVATATGDHRSMRGYFGTLGGESLRSVSSNRSSGEIWADTRLVVVCR